MNYVTADVIGAALDSVGGRGNQLASLDEIARIFNAAISQAGDGAYDGQPARLAALIGQCAQESAWFRTTTEYGTGQRYAPYIGRTFIQITWSDNYQAFGLWCKARGLIDDAAHFVNSPASLSDLKWAALGPIWYFATRGILPYADQRNWTAVGGIINTGSAAGVPGGNATRLKACQSVYDYLISHPIGEPAMPTATQLALAKWMTDRIGQFAYSQQDRFDNLTTDGDGQSADCSSLVLTAYREVAKVEVGTYTDAQAGNGRPVFDVNLEDVEQAIALLQPGDLVLVKHYIPAGSAYWDHVEMYVGDGKTCGHGGPGAGPQIHDFRAMWKQEKQLIARRYVTSDITTTPSEEEDIMSDPQVIDLLTQISRQTLGSADALTRGQSGIKWDGDAYRHLAIVSDALTSGYPANPDAGIEERPEGDIHRYLRELAERTPVEPERAEPEPETPAEPDASKEAIKAAVTAIRAAADAIEAQL